MANWEVTKTTKHGKPIEEYTTKIKKDHWKIESMPHIGAAFGSLYRWDDLRGLRLISTGNIDQLKRQAEGISGKNDAVSDLLRGFSRPGAKDVMAVEEGQVDVDGVKYRVLPYQLEYFKTDLAKFDDPKWRKQVVQQYLAKNYIKRFSRPGAKDVMEMTSEKQATITNKIAALLDKGIPIREAVEQVLGKGSWQMFANTLYDALRKKQGMSRPGAKDVMAVEDRFYFGKGRK